MGILKIFKRAGKKGQNIHFLDNKSRDLKDAAEKSQKGLPEYDIHLEFLDMINGKRINELFLGNTSLIPIQLRPKLEMHFNQAIENGLIYITSGKESIAQSFTKKELVSILKKNHLPITGNKIDLVERIESNEGLSTLHDTGKVSDWIKLSDPGKAKVSNYKDGFSMQYDVFQQNIYNLFLLKKIPEACNNILLFQNAYPFNKSNFFITHTDKELVEICNSVRYNNVLERMNVPKGYHDAILSIMCMYFSFGDFDCEKKIEELLEGFRGLLIKSDLIKHKDTPFIAFKDLLRGHK